MTLQIASNYNLCYIFQSIIISKLKFIFQDSERLYLRDSVEAETIKSSINRHRLAGYPSDIYTEIRSI